MATQPESGALIWQDREIRFDVPPPYVSLTRIRDHEERAAAQCSTIHARALGVSAHELFLT